ncbi:MAG: hypothetical protein AAGG48_32105 [Planctomycetota bacterium]
MQTLITRDDAIRLAREEAGNRNLAPWTIEDAILEDDNGQRCWRVMLDFDDPPLGLPGFIMINVHAETGVVQWPPKAL